MTEDTSTELAVPDRSAASVLTMLEQARTWLATCVEITGPAEIAAAKAQIVTAETYAKELRLSQDIQLDAQEMVRRAEFALGKSIRKGQAEGTIRTKADGGQPAHVLHGQTGEYEKKPGPTDYATESELSGNTGTDGTRTGIYAMVDGVEQEDLDTALKEAKAESNLTRANVVRKIKGTDTNYVTRDQRAEMIRELAAQNLTSRQMPAKIGVTEETVRQIARDYSIEIPADRSVAKTRRHDSNRIVAESVQALEGLAMGLQMVTYDDLDATQLNAWAESLSESMRHLNRFHKTLKEM